MSYQGRTNYETWNIALWIDNDYNYWKEIAEETEDDIELADRLKDEFGKAMPEVSGVWSDLLNAAFGEIDWLELARSRREE